MSAYQYPDTLPVTTTGGWARPVRTCLEYRDPERLEISTDCGLRRVPRYLTISKMSAAAEAARFLRASG